MGKVSQIYNNHIAELEMATTHHAQEAADIQTLARKTQLQPTEPQQQQTLKWRTAAAAPQMEDGTTRPQHLCS
jgi:hypothetical protein